MPENCVYDDFRFVEPGDLYISSETSDYRMFLHTTGAIRPPLPQIIVRKMLLPSKVQYASFAVCPQDVYGGFTPPTSFRFPNSNTKLFAFGFGYPDTKTVYLMRGRAQWGAIYRPTSEYRRTWGPRILLFVENTVREQMTNGVFYPLLPINQPTAGWARDAGEHEDSWWC